MATNRVIILNLTEPGRDPRLVIVSDQAVVGRHGDDIVVADPESSRRHVRFRTVEAGLEVTDLGSRNGTFVNGRRIEGPTVVTEGTWIDVGACRFLWDDHATAATMSTDPRAPSTAPVPPTPDARVGRPASVTGAHPWRQWIGPVVLVVVWIGVLAIARLFFLQTFLVPSASMEPTLRAGDHVVAVTRGVAGSTPAVGDVMIFENPLHPAPGESRYLVKRVIALPGDTLAFVDGAVVRNGDTVQEAWVPDGMRTEDLPDGHHCTAADPCVIPKGSVWMMGDNRADSFDSRGFGPVSTDAMVGRAVARFWPPGRIGGV